MKELRSFECLASVAATARAGTPLRAAKVLSRAPSSIYRAIERIEKDAGGRVFDRAPSGWTLTETGRRIVELAERMESEVVAAELDLIARARKLPPAIRVSASDGLANGYLGPILAAYVKQSSGPGVELIADNQFADLVRREADIAIRPDHQPGDELIGRRAGKLAHALYGASALIDRDGPPGSIADLGRFTVCLLSRELAHFTAASWWGNLGEACEFRTVLSANTETGLASMVAAGAGIAVLPCFLGDRLDGVTRLPAIAPAEPVDIWLVTHRALRDHRDVKTLLRYLTQAFSKDAAVFAGTSVKATAAPRNAAARRRGRRPSAD